MKNFHVYILASASKRLYVGVTNNLARRLGEHKSGQQGGFTARYSIRKLVRYEKFQDPLLAIEREKKVKNMPRSRKLNLVERDNPDWEDLVVE